MSTAKAKAKAALVKTPTILQMEALECGAAALAMILAYYGRWIPVEELRVLCGVSRDGSKALNIVKAARSLGMQAGGKRLEPAQLRALPTPAILFVNMNHFVVYEGVARGRFQLNDPAAGRRWVSPTELDEMFSGIVLTFEPTAEFKTGGSPPAVLPGLLQIARRTRGPLLWLAVLGLMLSLVGILLPGLQRIYVDRILVQELDDWVWPLAATLLAVAPFMALLAVMQGRLLATINAKLSMVLSSRMVWHLLRLPVMFFSQRYAGMISSRVALADQLVLTITRGLSQILVNLALLLMLVALMLQYSPTLTLIALVMGLLNALVFQRMRKSLGEASEKIAMQTVKMSGKAMQGLRMIETLKSTGTDAAFFANWSGLQALFINAQQEIGRREALLTALQALFASLTAAAILVVGGHLTMVETFSIGMLVAFSTISVLLNQPIQGLVSVAGTLQQTKGDLAQIDDTLRYPRAREFQNEAADALAPGERGQRRGAQGAQHQPPQMPGTGAAAATSPPLHLSGRVALEAVTFGYAPLETPLLDGLSLSIAPGSRIALVGGSGSGKSTIGKLVTGLFEPWRGRVLYDGHPLTDIPRDILRSSLAVVDQEIVLFEGSIRDNISLWDRTLPQAQIIRAAKDAMIHDVIMARTEGYDTKVEENGRNFSGGQRQRLEIARALATNPQLLVLDEATSALDTLTEQALMDNVRRRGCSLLIIAHRLSTIRDSDEIIVLDHGRVLQRGTHETLARVEGPYRELLET